MRTIAIIQARMTSTRLPKKVFLDLAGKPVLQNIVERINRAKYVDKAVVATSCEKSDDIIETFLKKNEINVYRGNLNNVLERFYLCAKNFEANVIVRCTADNALVDPGHIDLAIKEFMKNNLDYIYYESNLPIGMCIEVMSFNALEKAYYGATDSECLEHVTPFIRSNPSIFKVKNFTNFQETDNSELRLTIDTYQDYELISKIYNYYQTNDFCYSDIISVLEKFPSWKDINKSIIQNKVKYRGKV